MNPYIWVNVYVLNYSNNQRFSCFAYTFEMHSNTLRIKSVVPLVVPRKTSMYLCGMASVNYTLKDPKSANTTAVMAILTDGRNVRIKLYTGVSVKVGHWSSSKKFVHSANVNATALNSYLKKFKEKLLEVYLDAKMKGIKANSEYLKKEMFPEAEEVYNFWNVYEKFLNNGDFKHHLMQKYTALQKHLKEFEANTKPLHLDSIDDITLTDLQSFFWNTQKINTQTTAKYLQFFKTFLGWATKRKYTTNLQWQSFKAKGQPEDLKVIITDSELQLLKNLRPEKQSLDNVRKLFLLSIYTGLRFSDYTAIKPHHISNDPDGDLVLKIRQSKTKTFVEIPIIDPTAKAIINELIAGTVRPISNQKMNSYVKEVCQLAGINEACEKTVYHGQNEETQIYPKHELITTHTGRRTFATNLLLKGLPAETVMQFTGHLSYAAFRKYINIPQATKMASFKKAMTVKTALRVA